MSSHDSNFSGSLTPIDDPLVEVIGVRDLQHREESGNGEQGKCNVTTSVLSDDALREVFYHYCHMKDAGLVAWMCQPECAIRWQPLVHVCQRWRRIVFASPHYLDLHLLCDNKTPARDSLNIWPPLPIVLSYKPSFLNGEQNMITALEHQDRITKIIFPLKSPTVLRTLSPFMQEPLPALTELDLWGEMEPDLPEAFLGGSAPRLRTCALRGIGFPELPKLLASTSQLVSLLLHDIPVSGYISPDAMGSCLATLPNLNRLILEFKSLTARPQFTSPPPPTRDILPSLTHFEFTGRGEYLEDLVARIDAPCLYHCVVTFSIDLDSIPSQLLRFISHSERIKELKELHRDDREVELRPWSVRMTDESGGRLELRIRSPIELGSLARLCDNISPLLSQVGRLRIRGDLDSLHRLERAAAADTISWVDVFVPFSAVRYLSISTSMAPIVVGALGELSRDGHEEVLPELDGMDFDYLDPRDREVLNDFVSDRRSYVDRKIVVMERL